jgi:peptidyl-prolyl cis-trans isomerase SurA
MSARLGEALAKMSPGQMSYPVRTPAGFYILYLMDRRTVGAADPAQIVLSLDQVVFALPANAPAAERERIEAEAQQISATAKNCDELSKIGRERAPQLSRRVPEMRASELPPQLRQQILALKVSEASKPIAVPGGVGVVMVCDRQDPSAMPSRDDVTENLARERYDTLARRYLRNLRRSAYVDIRG